MKRRSRWLWGCGGLAALPFLIVLTVLILTLLPHRRADQVLSDLEQRFPTGSFVPSTDGSLPPGDIDRFLAVQEQLAPSCDELRRVFGWMAAVEQDEVPGEGGVAEARRALRMTGNVLGAAGNITPSVAGFFEARNRALLEAGMGLEEYRYLFLAAYGARLDDAGMGRMPFNREGVVPGQVRAQVVEFLERTGTSGVLLAEAEALRADGARLPFAEGPAATAFGDQFAGRRERLDALFCVGRAGIELDREGTRALRIAVE
ncbi:hypothetical protein ABI59_17775 [Acidobacteria bacterium Mor1]|nr:hypothetical protein ABI59_17775 [Acidobacteria bacterium Mor1]